MVLIGDPYWVDDGSDVWALGTDDLWHRRWHRDQLARQGAVFVHDTVRDEYVMFNCYPSRAGSGVVETVILRGADFAVLHPSHSPSYRHQAAMAWHAGLRKTLLFGGGQSFYGPR